MKIITTVLLFAMCFMQQGLAQNNISNDIVASQDSVSQKLVELALQNAQIKVADYQIDAAKAQIKLAKASWLNVVGLSGNINEYSINPPKGNLNIYYPRYNFGATIPLGLFTTHANQVKAAKAEMAMSQQEKQVKIDQIKEQVLAKYQDYIMYKQQLTLQSSIVQNQYNLYIQAEQKFKSGQISIDDYNTALKSYNVELTTKITLQHDLNVAKLEIEQLIGVPLESVINSAPTTSSSN